MCGRYYMDIDTADEIEKIIRRVDGKIKAGADQTMRVRDIHPTEAAPILAASNQKLCCCRQRWGFPKQQEGADFRGQGKQVIFNARSESALEKRTFRESVRHRRIIIPAAGFYEWNRNREKSTFYRKSQPVLFLAGFYHIYQGEERFVILTTEANESVKPVHDRMPLILEEDEMLPWIFDDEKTETFLSKQPCLLERKTEFEQMSLF